MKSLFIFVGLPENGKTTCSIALANKLNCPIIHTDIVFDQWIQQNYHKYSPYSRKYIMWLHKTLSAPILLKWHEYLTDYILQAICQDSEIIVAEGWLIGKLPYVCIEKWATQATVIPVTMRKYVAYYNEQKFAADKDDYTNVIVGLEQILETVKENT